ISEKELRRKVTVIGQKAYLFNETVAENLRVANPDAGDTELWRALEQAALAERISKIRKACRPYSVRGASDCPVESRGVLPWRVPF
ncbi:MAG: hypothetical protein RLN70_02085, partial [Rhodospirillaceae bacterium]